MKAEKLTGNLNVISEHAKRRKRKGAVCRIEPPLLYFVITCLNTHCKK